MEYLLTIREGIERQQSFTYLFAFISRASGGGAIRRRKGGHQIIMNRTQKRWCQKNSKSRKKLAPLNKPKTTDFNSVPTETICQSIQLLINELHRRGVRLYDFDNKNRHIFQIQIMQGKIYFLMEEEGKEVGET